MSIEPNPIEPPVFADSIENEIRTWATGDEKTLDARFATVIGDKAVLTDESGRQRKIQLARLSGEDRTFVELAKPPKFNIDFSKKSAQVIVEVDSPYWASGGRVGRSDYNYIFGAKLKQVSAGKYNHELKVEFFAIGEEYDGDNYILFDRQESRFTPTKENGRSHAFHGDTIRLTRRFLGIQNRGQKYGGYLVVVTDERGMVVDFGASHKWLVDILGNLRQLPAGVHFNKTGTRVFPPSPKRWYW